MVDEDHLVGVFGQHGKIVGGHKDGQVIGFADLVQHIHETDHTFNVHTAQGLVQDQNIGHGLQGQSQQHPLQLAAGEGAHPLVNQVLPVYPLQTFQHGFPQVFSETKESGASAQTAGKQVCNGDGIAGIKGGGLGDIANAGFDLALARYGEDDDTVIFPLPKERFQKGGFACAVGADEGHHLTAVDMKVHIRQNLVRTDGHGYILHPQAAGIVTSAGVERYFH